MDRLNQIRSETGSSRDLTLDTSSPPSESFMTANETSSKFYSLSDVDSTFDVSPTKGSVISTVAESDQTIPDTELISNLSPISKKVDNYKIGKQIEAANILSGGVNIFDDNDNSYDGDELVIDDNIVIDDEKPRSEVKNDAALQYEKAEENVLESVDVADATQSKDSEVVLQIDGKNVDAIDIGNGLYLYRKTGEEELAAVQIVDDGQQQQSFKFLKVRENTEGNLEVYEEIEIEVSKEVPIKGGKPVEKNCHVPNKDISNVICEPSCNKDSDNVNKTLRKDLLLSSEIKSDSNIELQCEGKSEVNINGKMMKFTESRKSPVISTFTPMTYHSTPNKECMGIPLTKTMVDQQLHPNRHSDNVKKTIEVHTDTKQKAIDSPIKSKDLNDLSSTEESPFASSNKSLLNAESLVPLKGLQIDKTNCSSTDLVIETKDCEHNETCERVTNSTELNTACKVLTFDCDEIKTNTQESSTKFIDTEEKKLLKLEPEKSIINIDMDSKSLERQSGHFTESTSRTNDSTIDLDASRCKDELSKKLITHVEVELDINNKSENINETIQLSNEIKESDIDHKVDKCDKETSDASPIIKQETKSDNINISQNENQKEATSPIGGVATKEAVTQESNDMSINDTGNLINTTENIEIAAKAKSSLIEENVILLDNVNSVVENKTKNPMNTCEDIGTHNAIADTNKDVTSDVKKHSYNIQNTVLSCQETAGNVPAKLNIMETPLNCKDSSSKLEIIPYRSTIKINSLNPVMIVRDEGKTSLIPDNIVTIASQSKITNLTENLKVKSKSNVNNNAAVPFGKWTEANRQEFLNKIKETKVPCSNTNTKQLKQPNDLNRRDVLKKIDSQRQSNQAITKNKELAMSKLNYKTDPPTVFINKPLTSLKPHLLETKTNNNTETSQKVKSTESKKSFNDSSKKPSHETANVPCNIKVSNQRKEIINNQDLIDKTIEGIINRAVLSKPQNEIKQTDDTDIANKQKNNRSFPVSLDEIEKKMNELHGIPFIERPAHELPQVHNYDVKPEKDKANKDNKTPYQLILKNNDSAKQVKENVIDDLSDEEIIEHEPITGDLGLIVPKISTTKTVTEGLKNKHTVGMEEHIKEAIITEKDFDKFVRRNSITYENCLTVNFDGKETHNVIKTIVEKDAPVKKLSRNEQMLAESKAKSTYKHFQQRHHNHLSKIPTSTKQINSNEESQNRNYQSKVQLAYQTAMTAKRQKECPITIIEDKPVKVVYMDSAADFSSTHLNVQGQELSPSKRSIFDMCDIRSASESVDSDVILDVDQVSKLQDDSRSKGKHQRKQVLTPVETPELELIEPSDLGIELSTKKRRKVEENYSKNLVPKKSYLLHRNNMDQKKEKIQNISENVITEPSKCNDKFVSAITAIDNLVKAAELLETQSENKGTSENIIKSSSEVSISTPTKRGRGRPRKFPPTEAETVSEVLPTVNTPSPQKKPRLLDSKLIILGQMEDSSDDDMIQENWTMGKINENIVCPICNKLFRSENVVFKHVKHCTGPSPNRSDSDRRSTRGFRQSQESERKSNHSTSEGTDSEDEPIISTKYNKAKDTDTKPKDDKDDVIIIDDTPKKRDPEEAKVRESRKTINKHKLLPIVDNLTCEYCGKTFRQLSYLVNHKLQHQTRNTNKIESNQVVDNKSVLSCEVCKKEFRKLHHLVQHRIIHNPTAVPSRSLRKSSNEQIEAKVQNETKASVDQSAGFRCEPCDKSFRKLHHLVEHRETHDGINKKSSSGTSPHVEIVKTTPVHVCDVCKKTFKKLQHLLEHKEQHLDNCSEKSDDKSVKSSLSTRDIIHECSLCYMVFPNEHSLNKHTIICLRKKKQSANKQAKLAEEKAKQESEQETKAEGLCTDEKKQYVVDDNHSYCSHDENEVIVQKEETRTTPEPVTEINHSAEVSQKDNIELYQNNILSDVIPKIENTEVKSVNIDDSSSNRSAVEESTNVNKINNIVDDPLPTINTIEVITIPDTPTPKKKTPAKEKMAGTVTKRQKSVNTVHVVSNEQLTESSDDDEIRYMFNPNFKESSNESKVFMKVRANKRSSLQIERPDSKNLMKRRISLQHPPRLPRLKVKAVERKPSKPEAVVKPITPVIDAAPSTDSDDSDVKYSFPENVNLENTKKNREKKNKRQTAAAKRKSITGIAKRKSLGKHKISSSTQIIRKRTTEADHRCDCGQLFSSAALLARHTTLAHTPPRIRRRRSPPPESHEPAHKQPHKSPQQQTLKPPHQTANKSPHQPPDKPPQQTQKLPQQTQKLPQQTQKLPQQPSQKPTQQAHKPLAKRKAISDTPKPNTIVKKPKSNISNKNTSMPSATRKSCVSEIKSSDSDNIVKCESNTKILRSAAHRGVPVPEKMRKFMEK